MSKKANRIALLAKNGNISSGITKADDGWNDLTQVENYVEKIELPKLNTDTDIQNILTAIPSPWARAYMQYAALLRHTLLIRSEKVQITPAKLKIL